jgi:hypothetical protein
MTSIFRLRWFVLCGAVFLIVLTAGCSSDSGEASASGQAALSRPGGKMPASVPGGYVATPYGFFDPSCVERINPGETAQSDGTIVDSSGGVRTAAKCTKARFDPTGSPMPIGKAGGQKSATSVPSATSPAASTYNGWLENYSTTSTGALSYLAATWVVPQTPAAGSDGQVLFFFNGLEGLPTVESILQPVLAYENGEWFAQSWNCCASGTTYNAGTIPVSPGDVIVGTINGTNCDTSSGLCNNWTIETLDQNTGQSSVLQTSAWGVAENWVFAGVLEVYGVGSCDDLSASGSIAFDNIAYTTVGNTGAGASWSLGLGSVTPSCGYGGQDNGTSVVLDFTGAASGSVVTTYNFGTLADPGSCMDARAAGTADGTQIQEWGCNGTVAQSFATLGQGGNVVTLYNPNANKCVDVANSGTADGTQIRLWDCNGTAAQNFVLQPAANGFVTIVNTNSNKCLDVQGDNPANGTVVQLYDGNGTNAQLWNPAAVGTVTL